MKVVHRPAVEMACEGKSPVVGGRDSEACGMETGQGTDQQGAEARVPSTQSRAEATAQGYTLLLQEKRARARHRGARDS